MKKSLTRQLSVLLVLYLIGSLFFSAFFLSALKGHQCEEEDCPICAVLELCEKNLRLQGNRCEALLLPSLPGKSSPLLPPGSSLLPPLTPVSLRVRLDH